MTVHYFLECLIYKLPVSLTHAILSSWSGFISYLNLCLIIIIFWPFPLKEAQLVEDKNEQGEE